MIHLLNYKSPPSDLDPTLRSTKDAKRRELLNFIQNPVTAPALPLMHTYKLAGIRAYNWEEVAPEFLNIFFGWIPLRWLRT